MALDILGRQLFISCKDDDVSGSVHVWRLHDVTNDYVGVIIDKRTDIATGAVPSPRAIAIFPQLNFLFYVDAKHPASIIRCRLDGRDCRRWHPHHHKDNNNNNANMVQAQSLLHADERGGRLYFTTTDGVWSRAIVDDQPTSRRHHISSIASRIVDLAIVGRRLLVVARYGGAHATNNANDKIYQRHVDADVESLDHLALMTPIQQQTHGKVAITSLSVTRTRPDLMTTISSPCVTARCSHLCRVVITDDAHRTHQCLCPLGYGIGAGSIDVCREHIVCPVASIMCTDGLACIHAQQRCNGRVNCADGSDESICANLSRDRWPCDTGGDIFREQLCDGRRDCVDGSDERYCRCDREREFDCTGWDEQFDAHTSMVDCVPIAAACNGVRDCLSGADEREAYCGGAYLRVSQKPAVDAPPPVHHSSSITDTRLLLVMVVVAVLIIVLVMFVICTVVMCRWQSPPTPSSVNNNSAEAHVILPAGGSASQNGANGSGTMCHFELRTFYGPSSSDQQHHQHHHYFSDALPPPNSHVSGVYQRSLLTGKSRSSTTARTTSDDQQQQRPWCAPPNSAASLSTYGVVKPASMRTRSTDAARHRNRNQRPARRRAPAAIYHHQHRTTMIDDGIESDEDEVDVLLMPASNARLTTPPPTYLQAIKHSPSSGSHQRRSRSTDAARYDSVYTAGLNSATATLPPPKRNDAIIDATRSNTTIRPHHHHRHQRVLMSPSMRPAPVASSTPNATVGYAIRNTSGGAGGFRAPSNSRVVSSTDSEPIIYENVRNEAIASGADAPSSSISTSS